MLHTKDIHRPSPWISSHGVGVAAGFGSSAFMTRLNVVQIRDCFLSRDKLRNQKTATEIADYD